MAPKGKGKQPTKKQTVRFVLDCEQPVNDQVLDPASFVKFLHDRIKVDGKTGQLGESVTIKQDDSKIVVAADFPFSKRYLKYLTKKYLKKQNLRDYLRVVAAAKNTYEVKYFAIPPEEEE
mmetsp:Transcript_14931/g.31963  ORF Transcript_14931/g.31963 Transcript_14931/m.31963 type:complete len:120 (-) Transcript_14931:30-389(-)